MLKPIRPTLTPAELAQLNETIAGCEEAAQIARNLADACRANGWYILARLSPFQPNETTAPDWGHWFYIHGVYADSDYNQPIGDIEYDGFGPRIGGDDLSAFIATVPDELWVKGTKRA